ncbi:MAG: patatin-like phospholipase family protein [Bacteroidota bacterium]
MKLGLCLSGGGTRGISHLGMLKALDEAGIQVDCISGTSAGALAGAMYASGYSPDEIYDVYTSSAALKYLRPAVNFRGIIKIDKARAYLLKYLPEDSFEALKIPLTVAATNLQAGRTDLFTEGPLVEPLLASSALPIIFNPVKIGDYTYVDGGILANMPVTPLVGKADLILALHCNPVRPEPQEKRYNFKSMMERTLMMAINYNADDQGKSADLLWEPDRLHGYKVFDVNRTKEIFEIGYQYAQERLAAGDEAVLKGEERPKKLGLSEA